MHGASEFIATVQSREDAFAAAIFAADAADAGACVAGMLADVSWRAWAARGAFAEPRLVSTPIR